jgi:hypothetical protein
VQCNDEVQEIHLIEIERIAQMFVTSDTFQIRFRWVIAQDVANYRFYFIFCHSLSGSCKKPLDSIQQQRTDVADDRHLRRLDDPHHRLGAALAEAGDGRGAEFRAAQPAASRALHEIAHGRHQCRERLLIGVADRRRDQAAAAQRYCPADMNSGAKLEGAFVMPEIKTSPDALDREVGAPVLRSAGP